MSDPTDPAGSHEHKTWICIVRKALLSGAAVVLPLLATIWVISFLLVQVWKAGDWILIQGARLVVGTIQWLEKFGAVDTDINAALEGTGKLELADQLRELFFSWPGGGLVRILLPLSIIGLIGAAAMRGVARHWFAKLEVWVQTLPVLGLIYKSVKQLMESFRGLSSQRNFKRVVYIDYPAPGCRLLAFVTGDFADPVTDEPKTVVFLPTSPNPLTGFTLVVDTDKVTECNIGLEAALKLVFTAGLVTPAKMGKTPEEIAAEAKLNDEPNAPKSDQA
ncbi:DUF502 domain-containing protein [Sulfuriroseicoccus oceanibius]|uniref:DUF502 domain-containing protein n=1 Tax=Sulfuriroseicoccus oceanibius TaxID=2707525 RepID=A0A6B3L9S1_9BACT|nr:DUF502 domain-containing protein [Sulfuriroseicoccus oceanibius]QQL44099.1 DUF502 domain-containing protein [Sulfuriroseicoccus oceanibius]